MRWCVLALLVGCNRDFLQAVICEPGAIQCAEDGATQICNAQGTAWLDGTCGDNQMCIKGTCGTPSACPDACRDIICTPGETFCGGNNIYVYECDDTGTTGCFKSSCASPPLDGVCFKGQCVSVCNELQKSYLGCEYFAADLDNAQVDCDGSPGGQYCDAAAEQFSVVVSNPDTSDTAYVIITQDELPVTPASDACIEPGTLASPDDFVAAGVIPPKGIKIFDLPRRDISATIQEKLAYRVASNIPISVYQFNPLENVNVFSNDASMLMPTSAADTEYYAMTRAQLSGTLRGFVTVVGVEDEPTSVTLTVSAQTGGGEGIPALAAGESLTVSLARFEVLNIETATDGGDLTGTHIVADKPIVVYSGHEAANAPTPLCDVATGTCVDDSNVTCGCDTLGCDPHLPCIVKLGRDFTPCCADHLEEQLFPVSTWGREYLAVRSYQRGSEGDVWRLLAAEDNTTITLTPALRPLPVLQAGEWTEFEADTDFVIEANNPILVGQFLVGEQSDGAGTGDPAFILTVPSRQFRNSYVFLAPNKYEKDYVSIALRSDATGLLDGDSLDTLAATLPGIVDVQTIDETWRAFRVPVTDGFHSLTCDQGCGVMVHGYDQYVSYGYPGGLNLLECSTSTDCPVERPVCDASFACVAQ